MRRNYCWLKLLIYLFIWGTLFYELLLNPSFRKSLTIFLHQYPLLAPMILVMLQLTMASFALPCSALSVLAGVLWGAWYGIIFSTLATILASMWTFLLGRTILTRFLRKRVDNGWCIKIHMLINKYQWRASMVAHANPIFPGSSLGYIFGLSDVTFSSFVVGAIMGTLPLQLVLVGIGHMSVETVLGSSNLWTGGLLALLIAALIFYKKAVAVALS